MRSPRFREEVRGSLFDVQPQSSLCHGQRFGVFVDDTLSHADGSVVRRGAHGAAHDPRPSRSRDLEVGDFSLWGYTKDTVYVPAFREIPADRKTAFTDAAGPITSDTLQNVYGEFDYRLNARHTRGGGRRRPSPSVRNVFHPARRSVTRDANFTGR